MTSGLRWYLLCEDRAQERFFVALGNKVLGSKPEQVFKAPAGEGSASQWVVAQYARRIRLHPRRYPQENVALLVVVDGDNEGCVKRKQRFDDTLLANQMSTRARHERVAICIPTWSIETWLAWLSDWQPPDGPIDERRTLKRSVERALDQKVIDLKTAAEAWSTRAVANGALPSLVDGVREMERLTIPLSS